MAQIIYRRFFLARLSLDSIASIFVFGIVNARLIASPVFRIASAPSETLKSAAFVFVMEA
jgi:hypothetical protein